MDEFRAAAGCSLAEIVLLKQQYVVAARRRIDRAADAGRPASDDDDVPRFGA